MTIRHSNDAAFEQDVLMREGPTLVDIYAPWCGPCKALAPMLDELAGEGVDVVKVNGDENTHVVRDYGVRGYPTLLLFASSPGRVGATVVRRLVGKPRSLQELRDFADA